MELAEQLAAHGYQCVRELGRGGMGVVYLATQQSLGREVAIKVLHTEACQPADLRRFRSEAKAIRSLQHPHVVRLLDTELEREPLFLVFEYVTGGRPLDELLPVFWKHGLAPLPLLTGILSGLAAVHAAGIIHRDVKPANILIDPAGEAKLIDFGLARAVSPDETRQTQEGQVLGTLSYMPPEQLLGTEVAQTADVYSFALLAVEVLAGRLIFSAQADESVRMTCAHRLAKGIPSVDNLCPEAPPRVRAVLRKCVAAAPADRPKDCQELLKRWEAAVGDEPDGDVTQRLEPATAKRGRTRPRNAPTVVPHGSGAASGFRVVQVAAVVAALSVLALVIAGRSSSRTESAAPPPRDAASSSRASSRPIDVVVGSDGDRLVLRITSEADVSVEKSWTSGGERFTQRMAPAKQHSIDLSATDMADSEDLEFAVGDRSVDLVHLVSPFVDQLGRLLERIPLDRTLRSIADLRARGLSGSELGQQVRRGLQPDTIAAIRRLSCVARHWLSKTTDSARRRALLRNLYRAELIDEFIQRSSAPPVLGAAACLPAAWREHGFVATNAQSPKFTFRFGAGTPRLDLKVLRSGVPHRLEYPVVAGAECLYYPLPLLLHHTPQSKKVMTDLLVDQSAGKVDPAA